MKLKDTKHKKVRDLIKNIVNFKVIRVAGRKAFQFLLQIIQSICISHKFTS